MAYKKLFSFKQYLTMIYLEVSLSGFEPEYDMEPYWVDIYDGDNFDVKSDTPIEYLLSWACGYLTVNKASGLNPAYHGNPTRQVGDHRVWEHGLIYYRNVYKAFRSWHENQTAHRGDSDGL